MVHVSFCEVRHRCLWKVQFNKHCHDVCLSVWELNRGFSQQTLFCIDCPAHRVHVLYCVLVNDLSATFNKTIASPPVPYPPVYNTMLML